MPVGFIQNPTVDLPTANTPFVNPDGTPNQTWYRYFQSITPPAGSATGSGSDLGILSLTDPAPIQKIADFEDRVQSLEPRWPVEQLAAALISSSSSTQVLINFSVSGGLQNNQVIFRWVAPVSLRFAAQMHDSQLVAAIAATGSSTFLIEQNGTQFATATFAAGAKISTFDGAKASFSKGDILTVVCPASVDATLEGLAGAFIATRN